MSFYICGVDEVGRGALAGPIMAVASLLCAPSNQDWSRGSPIPGIKDSKQFATREDREKVFKAILRCAELVDFGIGEGSVSEINADGIERANRNCFYRAVQDLRYQPDHILVDGNNPIPMWDRAKQEWRPKADAIWWPVGVASILAKVIRDRYMAEWHADYSVYGWGDNSGYGTEKHTQAIKKYGPSPLHRKKFIEKIVSQHDRVPTASSRI